MTTHRPIRVLIVDDEPDIVRLWSTLLRAEGYDVVGCTDPAKALAIVADRDVEVILCDHSMPGISGVELLSVASRLHPDVVRIMVTAFTSPDVVLRAVNEGHVERFLTKPCSAQQLRQTFREVAADIRVRRHDAGSPCRERVYELEEVATAQLQDLFAVTFKLYLETRSARWDAQQRLDVGAEMDRQAIEEDLSSTMAMLEELLADRRGEPDEDALGAQRWLDVTPGDATSSEAPVEATWLSIAENHLAAADVADDVARSVDEPWARTVALDRASVHRQVAARMLMRGAVAPC